MRSKLRASTLVELLVAMIVAGITVLIVMDGLNLLAAMYAVRTRRMRSFGERIEGFYRLDELVVYADSVVGDEYGGAEIWKEGRRTELSVCDSSLVCRRDGLCDTLLREMAGMRKSADSLFVELSDTLTLSFPLPVEIRAEYIRSIDSIECDFGYEEDRR